MSKKYTKSYNKQVMRTGEQANRYYQNALALLNEYTTDYEGRFDFWKSKLNDNYLNLVSDKYLAQNADMLRKSAAFGSNSTSNRQVQQNAYDQQNALANIANENVKQANQLQMNEMASLVNASSVYNAATAMGGTAAQNIDAANNTWLAVLGDSAQSAGKVFSAIPTPWTQIVGAALQTGGAAASSAAGKEVDLASIYTNTQNAVATASENYGSGELASRIKMGTTSSGSDSTLASKIGYNSNNYSGGLSSDWNSIRN